MRSLGGALRGASTPIRFKRLAHRAIPRDDRGIGVKVEVLFIASKERNVTVAGLTTIRSAFGPEETMNRLEAEVRTRGMTVFCHVDYSAVAAGAGLALRPTELLIFGAAGAATLLIEAAQTVAVDLPLKALTWQDEVGDTWLSYNEPAWLASRHGLGAATHKTVSAITAGLDEMTRKATGA